MTKHVIAQPAITLQQVESALQVTANAMERHPDLAAQVLPTLQRLEAERDRLLTEGDPVQYAKRLLASLMTPTPPG